MDDSAARRILVVDDHPTNRLKLSMAVKNLGHSASVAENGVQALEMLGTDKYDLDLLDDVANRIGGRTICALGDAAAMPVQSFLKHYRDEFQYHIDHGKCMV